MTEDCFRCEKSMGIDFRHEKCPYEGTWKCKEAQKEEQQEKPMDKPAVYYMGPESKYPDQIRLSFPDGNTVVYDRRIKQPGPRRYLNMPRHQKKGGR